MDTNRRPGWGERLAEQAASTNGDGRSPRHLLREAVRAVGGRLGDIRRDGIRPLLHEAAAQIRPATREELLRRYPGSSEDEIAKRLTERAAKTAVGVALGVGGVIAVQQAAATAAAGAPPAAGGVIGSIGVVALGEVLALFMVEAKLRTDLNALAGQPPATPKDLVAAVLGEVAAAGGWSKLRARSLRRVLPEAATRRIAVRLAAMVPRRFARIVVPEVLAPAIGSVFAARMAAKQVRDAGHEHWVELRGPAPTTQVIWGQPSHDDQGA